MWIETFPPSHTYKPPRVTPHTGVWIETSFELNLTDEVIVTPHTGVWIETLQGRLI